MGNKYFYSLTEKIDKNKYPQEFLDKIEGEHGEIDYQNDSFAPDLSHYLKTVSTHPETGVPEQDVIYLASFQKSFHALELAKNELEDLSNVKDVRADDKLRQITKDLRNVFNMLRTHIRRRYPEHYDLIKKQIDETSMTGGTGTATAGKGAQYTSPYAYKLVPKKVKGSGLEVKQLWEDDEQEEKDYTTFQQKRITDFKAIETELNHIYKLISVAEGETIRHYQENPGSYKVLKATDLILDYLKDIKKLLK